MQQLRIFIQAIPLAFFSRTLYRQVLNSWSGFGILYVLTLTAIFLVPVAIKRSYDLDIFLYGDKGKTSSGREELQSLINDITTQLPNITIKNAAITTNLKQPVYIKNPYSEEPLAIIDTSENAESLAVKLLEEKEATALITKDSIYIRGTTGEIKNITIRRLLHDLGLSTKTPIQINEKTKKQIQEFGLRAVELGPYALSFGDWVMGNFAFGVRALLFAGLGIFFCSLYGKRIDFVSLIRLAMVASTPVIVFEMASLFFVKNIFSNKDIIYFLMQAAYMHHAVESNVKGEASGQK